MHDAQGSFNSPADLYATQAPPLTAVAPSIPPIPLAPLTTPAAPTATQPVEPEASAATVAASAATVEAAEVVEPARAARVDTRPRRASILAPSFQLPVSERRVLLMAGDLMASVVSVIAALALWAQHAHYHFDMQFVLSQAGWLVVLPALWLLVAMVNDYYDLRVAAHVSASLRRLTLIVAEVMVVYVTVFFLTTPGHLPRRFIAFYAIISLALIGIWRAARIFLIGWTGFRRRAIIVGGGVEAEAMWRTLKNEAAGDYEVLGIIASEDVAAAGSGPASHVAGAPRLGSGADLQRIVVEQNVTELVMAYSGEMPGDMFTGLLACYELGVQVTPMARLYEQVTGRIPIEHISEQLWTLVLPEEARSLSIKLYGIWKRLTDMLLAVLGLALFAPLLPLLALIIVVESRGPVFYTQTRLGKAGAPFTIFKLRTMRANAEAISGAQWTKKGDPRVTRFGRFLRKTRLDEAPQLLNVLRGEMSIIGPRPERPEFVTPLAAEMPFYRARLAVKPGLTGWAQVRYQYGASREEAMRKLQYDLYYIRHMSPLLDVVIALKTLGVMLMFRGQ